MSTRDHDILDKVYAAKSDSEREAAYDAWANHYDADVFKFGYRLPAVLAAVFARFVDIDAGPVLDAGCGTGLQTEALVLAGYGPFVGVDLSSEMLSIARRKGLYKSLHKMNLGQLDFEADNFRTSLCCGAISPGHAGPETFAELIRVTRPGGLVVFSLRVDDGQLPEYPSAVRAHEREKRWKRLFATEGFPALPTGDPEVEDAVYVYRVLGGE
ncbi:MAG: class I SAM-dependent methyltransferase [Arenicellales bacterium]